MRRVVLCAPRLLSSTLLFLFLSGGMAFALEGRVIDERTGKPIPNAEVTILGRPGVVYTDADGRFNWKPDPAPPFEVLVILPGERFTKPVLIEQMPASGPIEVRISPLVDETVTVTAGAAPDIEATLGSSTSLLRAQEIINRQPANLTQALEGLAGVSSVSEGQAAVPAVRGLARGRTLILIDGARVTSDRRVGPSATFLDPFVLDGVEVARGPGSVAYGSDAFGGVIYARTRRTAAGAPLGARVIGAIGAGRSAGTGRRRADEGVRAGRDGGPGPLPRLRRLRQPVGDGVQLGRHRPGLPRARRPRGRARACSPRRGRATSAATSIARATTRRPSASTTPPKTRTASRPATTCGASAASSGWSSTGSWAATTRSPTRIGFPPRRAGARSNAPTTRPTTSRCAARPRSCSRGRGSSSART